MASAKALRHLQNIILDSLLMYSLYVTKKNNILTIVIFENYLALQCSNHTKVITRHRKRYDIYTLSIARLVK